MEKRMRISPQLEDIPELIHGIQSRLPVKEAARTSVLSKSWLHAWSTIPVLKFTQAVRSFTKEREREHLKVVDRTLKRYLRDNIPFKRVYLKFEIENQDSASFAENLIRPVAIRDCLTVLSLRILVSNCSFTLPDVILFGKNLTSISVYGCFSNIRSLSMTSHPVINCVSLKELNLHNLQISEEVLDNIFSTCSLLVMIKLVNCRGFKTIKIENLGHLYELRITSNEGNGTVLEIDNVRKLRLFRFDLHFRALPANPLPFNAHSISLGRRVTELWLGGVIMDNAFLDMIKSKFPFLKILTLHMRFWMLGSFSFKCNSMERLSLVSCASRLIKVQVKAPKLSSFSFIGMKMPTLLFPSAAISPLEQINLVLDLYRVDDASLFLKMRKAFMLSIKCEIEITTMNNILPTFDVDIDDLRKRAAFPAINVDKLLFRTKGDEGLSERSPFFDALFSICHPKHVVAHRDEPFIDNNHFSKLMTREVMEKKSSKGYWHDYLKDVEIRRHPDEKWETLTNSWRSFLDGSSSECLYFKLNWL